MNKILIRVFLSFGLILFLVYLMKDDLGKIVHSLLSANIPIFFGVFILYILIIVVASFRLKWMMKVQNIRLTLKEAASLNFVGNFFSMFLPTAIGGDVIKAYFASQKSRNKLGSYAAVFVDRFIGLIAIVFFAATALFLFGTSIPSVRISIVAIFILSFVAASLLLNKNLAKRFKFLKPPLKFFKIYDKIETAYNAINAYKNYRYLIVKSLILSLFVQAASFYLIFLLGKALYLKELSLKLVFFAMPIVSFMSMLPSIGGLGFREGAFVVLFGPFITREKAFTLSLLWFGIIILISVVGGIIYAFKGNFKVKLGKIQ